MKILIVNSGVFPIPPPKGGGTELHVYYLINNLAKLGHEIHVVTDMVKNSYFHPNINIIRIGSIPPSLNAGFFGWVLTHIIGGLLTFKKALVKIMQNDYEIVHVHTRLPGFLISLLYILKGRRSRLIYTHHNPGPWLCKYDSYFEEIIQKIAFLTMDLFICNYADNIIAVGKSLSHELIHRWKIKESKIKIISSGVDVNLFNRKQSHIEDVKKKYGILGDYILNVGQLLKRKGVNFLIEAMKNVDKTCVIVGDGPEKSTLKRLSTKYNLESKIIFTGSIPRYDLTRLYAGAKIFCLSSTAEGLPLTILEAMSSGLPIVTFNVGSISDVVIDDFNGYLVKVRDVNELSLKINSILSNEFLLETMGKRSEKFIRDNVSWESVALKILKIYTHAQKQMVM